MSMVALPYLGVRAADQELSKPAHGPARVRARKVSRGAEADVLRELTIRLTYRTARTLTAIAENPGASNRDIGSAAGIADQGQISKLLQRLARLDLIENTGLGQPSGASNAWWLTDRGKRLQRAAWAR
jgi:DNA-binding MarR family transcriptional regulator